MIEVIDISKAIPPELLAYTEVISAIVPDIAEAARTEIIRLANERLGTSTEDYVQGVSPVKYHFPNGKIPPGEHVVATITLLGEMPNRIEQGWAGGDMKPALLAGPNAKTGEHGRYNTVPFRHGTPGTSGRNFPAMGSQFMPGFRMGPSGVIQTGTSKDHARKLGKAVHRAAKALAGTVSHPGKGVSYGERLKAGMAPLLRPHHKTDVFAGMIREEKTYKKTTQSQYITFRRVSENSDPGAWIHPGIEAHRLFPEAGKYVGRVAGHLFQQALQSVDHGAR